jgi:hypothetical protein
LGGDVGDGIPNIFQPDDYLVNKDKYASVKFQRLTAGFKQEFAALTEEERESHPEYGRNYVRNRELVMFDFIPSQVVEPIEEILVHRFKNSLSSNPLDRIKAATSRAVM